VDDTADLIQKFLNGTITAEEHAALDRLLTADPAAADALARASAIDGALADHFAAEGEAERSSAVACRAVQALHGGDDYVPAASPRRRLYPAVAATIAMMLMATALGIYWSRTKPGEPAAATTQLLNGRVLVDGEPNQPIRDGSTVQVLETALVRLADGSEAALSPGSQVVFRGRVGDVRQVVALERGNGSFKVQKGDRQFRVDTPVGRVAVVGTAFDVNLQEFQSVEGDDAMVKQTLMTLAVLVSAGQVEVQVDGRLYSLDAGQGRVFAEEKPRGESRRADMTGRLVKYDAEAGTLSIAGKENQGVVTFAVAKDVNFESDRKDAKLSDLGQNETVYLTLSDDKTTVMAVRVSALEGKAIRMWLSDVDPVKMTATFKGEKANQSMDLAKDVVVTIDGKPAKLEDVKANDRGVMTYLTLDGDRKISILKIGAVRDGDDGEGAPRERRPDFNGRVAEYDSTKGVLKMAGGDGDQTRTFNIDKDTKVMVDGKLANLADIATNTYAAVILSDDRTTVVLLRVDNKPDRRIIQSVDSAKYTIQFRAEGRELIFPVVKDVVVTIDGKVSVLGDIQPDSPATVNMSADRKKVMAITIGKRGRGDAPREGGERKPAEGADADGEKKPAVKKDGDGVKKPEGKGDGVKKPEGKGDGVKKPEGKGDGGVKKPEGE